MPTPGAPRHRPGGGSPAMRTDLDAGPPRADTSGIGRFELRALLGQLDPEPLFHGELLHSLRWLARYVHAPLGEVLATALPAALRRGEPLPDEIDRFTRPS